MTKAEMEFYKDKKPIAVYSMSNWGGIEILDIIYGIDDYVVARYNFGKAEDKVHKVKIRYGADDNTYFRLDDYRVNLDECMRV